ncbi:MAG: peptidyl-prolyl cis-trans isomerase [Chthoniobacteraceae bacterium]|nr:peptidyl-prolyl cis-trans isomerase [Chthoniobacteraceae bacterium]
MHFRKLALLASLIVLTVLPARAEEQILDGIAAVVNGEVITFSQVRELVVTREMSLRQSLQGQALADKIKETRLAAINDLIDRQLVLQDFQKNKFNIPEYAVDDHVNTIIREEFQGDRLAFIRTLQAQGYTLQRFRKVETDKMIVQAMRQRAVKTEPILSPSKVERYYRDHQAEYSTPEQIKLRMIVLHKDSIDAKNVAKEISKKVRDGAEFGQMAQMYSEDASKETGGDWGWIERNTLNETLSKPAFALKAGRVSDIVELGANYYLLYVEARKNAETKPLATVRDDVEKKVLQSERQALQDKWIAGLRSKAYIRIF